MTASEVQAYLLHITKTISGVALVVKKLYLDYN